MGHTTRELTQMIVETSSALLRVRKVLAGFLVLVDIKLFLLLDYGSFINSNIEELGRLVFFSTKKKE